jgi:N utilization substance protein A
MAVLSNGRRCPNAAIEGSTYCGLPQHQALSRFDTNQMAVLGPVSETEVEILADPDADQGQVDEIVAKAEAEFVEEAPEEEVPEELAAGPVAAEGDSDGSTAGPVAAEDSSSSQAAGEEPTPTPPAEDAAENELSQDEAGEDSAESPEAESEEPVVEEAEQS